MCARFERFPFVLLTALYAAVLPLCHAAARPIDPSALPVGSEQFITLDTGETIRITVEAHEADAAIVSHSVFGRLRVPWARVSGTAPVIAEQEAAAAMAAAPAITPIDPSPPPAPPPAPEPAIAAESELNYFQGWTGQLEGGANGSDGNTEKLSARIGFRADRITDELESRFASLYVYATDSGEKTQSRGEISFRQDWLSKESPWGFFAQGKAEYDEFQDWDWRLSAFAGPTYTVIKNDTTFLRLRAGAGVSRELGGSENDLIPEALFGVDFTHKFDERQKIFANYEYLPSLKNFSDYRMVTKAGYEILIDPKNNISLRLGLEDRYDSEPGPDRRRNDIDYFALIVWAF